MNRYPAPELKDLPEDIMARVLEVQEKAGFVPNVFLALARRPAEWRAFFEGFELGVSLPPKAAKGAAPAAGGVDAAAQWKVLAAINAYRTIGHQQARINPLADPVPHFELTEKALGLDGIPADRVFHTGDFLGGKMLPLGEILAKEEKPVSADPDAIDQRLYQLERDRDAIGPVNLRAEEEATELGERVSTMKEERLDLTAAIAKLREGIDALNAEGRERLLAAFDIINGHFQALFATLFGGGQAELRLVENDDPLEAGLEIYACPPGKRLSTMSLMSGGEQALTAAALIFGVFLANPAPVCVLDEVDAPLDDANVDRFCNMLDEMRLRTKTRFIAITHNAVTMSRMDRLYGVTMPERGVSQLVSVDLRQAEAMVA